MTRFLAAAGRSRLAGRPAGDELFAQQGAVAQPQRRLVVAQLLRAALQLGAADRGAIGDQLLGVEDDLALAAEELR